MLRLRWKKIKIALLVILFFVLVTGLAFLLRSPVLIVSDESFDRLYGHARLRQQRMRVSMELFRRVIPVSVAETAGDDLITIAIEGAASSPGMVLFPYRYLEGANYYREKYPDVPVFIIGSERPRNAGPLVFVKTNVEEDTYRAGFCAALLAGDKRVLFIGEGNVNNYYWEIFRQALIGQDHDKNPVYINVSADYSSYDDVGCVVIAGPAAKYLEKNLNIPIILFSWVDPSLTPRSVKIIFDDSVWALAADVLKKYTSPEYSAEAASAGENPENSDSAQAYDILIPSKPLVIPGRMEEKRDFRRIQRIIKENSKKSKKNRP